MTDNTVTHAADLAPFVARLRGLPGFTSCGVAVGNGFELTVRRSSSDGIEPVARFARKRHLSSIRHARPPS